MLLAPLLIRRGLSFSAALASIVSLLSLNGCSTISSWFSNNEHKPGPIPSFTPTQTTRINWQNYLGKSTEIGSAFTPALIGQAIFAATSEGIVRRIDLPSGRVDWHTPLESKLSAGVGADKTRVVVVSSKGEIFALTTDSGRLLWKTQMNGEIYTAPLVTESRVIIWSSDGRTSALDADTGTLKWTHQRAIPPLSVRNYVGGLAQGNSLFFGTAGGKLLSLRLEDGATQWEEAITSPKGATELERIADVTSLPYLDDRQICAAAFQGRVACFDLQQGTLLWSREFGSFAGITGDQQYLYLTDDQGAIIALDKTTGASVWKQDKLVSRRPSGPAKLGNWLVVADFEGYYYFIDTTQGHFVGITPSDGSPPQTGIVSQGSQIISQSQKGTLFSLVAR